MNRKYAKTEVSFEHPAKGKDHCNECSHYEPGAERCQIVSGTIMPDDWCRKFKPKATIARRV